jgi:hypothetical protein
LGRRRLRQSSRTDLFDLLHVGPDQILLDERAGFGLALLHGFGRVLALGVTQRNRTRPRRGSAAVRRRALLQRFAHRSAPGDRRGPRVRCETVSSLTQVK